MALTGAERAQRLRDDRKRKGLVKKEVWIRPEHSETLKQIEKQLRQESYSIQLIYDK